jgi:polysaccharide biosynthesis protein VpsJ
VEHEDDQLRDVLSQLEGWGARRGWVGPDPYEGLNAPVARLARHPRPRQVLIQAYKRLPIPPRWPMRAAPQPNSKALALALSGYTTAAGRSLPGAERYLEELPRELKVLGIPAAGGAGWGYHFDAQTRHLYYPREIPNAVATSFVVGALLDLHEATTKPRYADLALSARPYLLSLLKPSSYGPHFAYVASGSELIHNANVMVAGILARLEQLAPEPAAAAAAVDATQTTLALQAPDGIWPYGERSDLDWVDSFHTAYLLEGLLHVERAFGLGRPELERGLRTWQARFFRADGWARYFPDRDFPLEAHSYASAIDLLCLLPDGDPSIGFATRVAHSAVRELWLPEANRFAFRRTSRRLNKREFMRWTNAPMFRALARLASRENPAPRL